MVSSNRTGEEGNRNIHEEDEEDDSESESGSDSDLHNNNELENEDEGNEINNDKQNSDNDNSTGDELFAYFDDGDEHASAAAFIDNEIDPALFADEAVPLSSDESHNLASVEGGWGGCDDREQVHLDGEQGRGRENDEEAPGSWNSLSAGGSSSENTEADFSAFVRKAWGDRVDELAGPTTPTTPPAATNHSSGPHNTVA